MTDIVGNGTSGAHERLFDAVQRGDTNAVEELLSEGVPVDSRDDKERTPLMKASADGNLAMVMKCVDHGADINAVDMYGDTPLGAAAYRDHIEVVQFLVANGADLDIRNNEGLTAPAMAQEVGANAVAAFLAAQVASPASPEDEEPLAEPDDDEPGPRGPAAESVAEDMVQETAPHVAREDFPDSGAASGSAAAAPSFRAAIPEVDYAVVDKIAAGLAPQANVPAVNEERIIFDALDNKQVRSINEKIKKVFDKAGFEVGDYVIDTVFKGSYLAVLKPRSQENKRWKKLRKHPDWDIDTRRLTELIGGCAARRLCLAEGIGVSSFSLSHFIELYYAKDSKMILALAEEAITNKYTVRQLKKAVDDLREHKDEHDPGKEIIRTLDQAVPLLEDPDLMDLCKDKDRVLEELSKTQRKKIRALIKTRKPALDEWKGLMDTFEGILSSLAEE